MEWSRDNFGNLLIKDNILNDCHSNEALSYMQSVMVCVCVCVCVCVYVYMCVVFGVWNLNINEQSFSSALGQKHY